MSQLPTSPFPKWGTSGPGNVLAPSADKQTGEGDINGATGVLYCYIIKVYLVSLAISASNP